jgi:hypothetical protein
VSKFIQLGVTNKTNSFTVDHTSSGGVLGSEYVLQNGGTFRFRIGYVSNTTGKQSALSQFIKVQVRQNYAKSTTTNSTTSTTQSIASNVTKSATNITTSYKAINGTK